MRGCSSVVTRHSSRLFLESTFLRVARYAGMDSIAHDQAAANDEHYGVEVLCSGWNPLVASAAQPVEACRGLMAELAGVEVETFLARFYHFQQG